jgi:hypothetical protein
VAIHHTDIVARQKGKNPPHSWRWKCTCGASTGGKWLRSEEEATKAVARHLQRANAADELDLAEHGHLESNVLADLNWELRHILNLWDPIGIYDEKTDYPPDEYDCMIAPLISRLDDGADRAAISEFLWNEVREHYGLDPVYAHTDEVADTLVAWFKLQGGSQK